FDTGARELPRILFELGLQPLEQREGIGGRAGEAADHIAFAEFADLPGIGLDHGLADRNLAVAADDHPSALADGEDRGAVPALGLRILHMVYPLTGSHLRSSRGGCKLWLGRARNPQNP